MNKQDVKEYFNQHADKREKWKKKNNYYHAEVRSLLKFLVPENASVLDIGCSIGDILADLKPSRGVGVDISPKVLEIARARYPHLTFTEADAEHLDLEGKFDYIILTDVIGFFDDVQQAFAQLQKYSHSKTKIIITYFNYLWEPVMKAAEKFSMKMKNPINNWLSRLDVDNLLYLADFEVIKKGGRLLFPKKIPLLSSFFNHFLAKFPLFRNLCLVNFVVARPKPMVQPLKPNPSVSVVIPARNEKGNIEAAIKRMPRLGSRTEVVFVEGHSQDNTWEEIQRVKNAYPDWEIKTMIQDGKGKGDAVRKGFDAATGDILMILDADLTVRPEELPKFYHAIATGKLRRYWDWRNVSDLGLRVPTGYLQSLRLLRRLAPNLLFATGGFVALPPALAARRPDLAERFLREARAMATVEHARVVRVYSFGEAAGQEIVVLSVLTSTSGFAGYPNPQPATGPF